MFDVRLFPVRDAPPDVTDHHYDVEVIQGRDHLASFMPAWKSFLADDVRGYQLFNDPSFITMRLETEPNCSLLVVVLRDRGRIRAIAAFCLAPRRFSLSFSVLRLMSVPVTVVKLFGDELLVAPDENPDKCVATAFDAIDRAATFGYILLDRVLVPSAVWDYCRANVSARGRLRFYLASTGMELVHQVRLPATHDEYMASLGPRTRQNLRRMTRKMVGERQVRLVRVTTADQVATFLDKVDHIFRNSWQAKTFGESRRNSGTQLQLLTRMAQSGWLRSYVLENDAGPIAFELGYQHAGVFYGIETAFAQSWSDYGPGTVLTHLFIEDLFRYQPPTRLDFGFGDAAYKRGFSNLALQAAAAFLVPRNRWRMILALQRSLHAAEFWGRSLATALRLDRVIRKLLKRQH